MKELIDALLSTERSPLLPEKFDYWKDLIGAWEFDCADGYDRAEQRHLKGEWIFSRMLEGLGIIDMFICPSRDTRKLNPQPDGEYGVALRKFCAKRKSTVEPIAPCARLVDKVERHLQGRFILQQVSDFTSGLPYECGRDAKSQSPQCGVGSEHALAASKQTASEPYLWRRVGDDIKGGCRKWTKFACGSPSFGTFWGICSVLSAFRGVLVHNFGFLCSKT